ncbi:MAG: tetratricopeptide repeat protein, partial [Bacteroidota bacterium]
MALFIAGCSMDKDRKIKLASGEAQQETGVRTAASVLQVSPEEQRSIAILNFENKTGDASLDWLRRGLADMLVAELGQSPYLNIVPMNRLSDVAQRLGKETGDVGDVAVAQVVARDAQVEMILSGRFYRDGTDLRIDSDLRDVGTGQILRRATVRGPGLERIFAMVDELSEELRTNLRGDLAVAQLADVHLLDMTQSVEAFRCYSEGLDNLEKLQFAEAVSCLREAIGYDSTFAAAYLRLSGLGSWLGGSEVGRHALRQARRHADKLSAPDRIRLRLFEATGIEDRVQLIPDMEELLQFSPYDIDTRMQLAGLLFGMQKFGRAIEEYQIILDLDPERKLAYNQLGYLFARRGDFTTALKYLEKYQQLAPDEHNPYDSMGEVLMWSGRLEEAAEYLKTALTKMPSFYQSAMKLTEIYSELGDFEQALAYSKKAMAAAPNDHLKSIFYGQRAYLYWRFGRTKQAVQAANRALETYPDMAGHALRAGILFKAIGDTAAARHVYRSYFDRYKKAIASGRSDYQLMGSGAMAFLLEADLPRLEVIQTLEEFAKTQGPTLERQLCVASLGTLYMRVGEYQKAKQFQQGIGEFFSLIAKLPAGGRGAGWKHLVEAIHLEPKGDSPDYTIPNQLLEVAQTAGRKDFEYIARLVRAQYHGKYGRGDELAAEYRDLGSPVEDDWMIIGPFKNRSGFLRTF